MQFFFGKRAFARRLNSMLHSRELRFERRTCLCRRADATRLISYGRYGEEHPVGICRHCGLIYASPYFDAQSLAWFYGSDEYRRLYDGDDLVELAQLRLKEGWGRQILELVSTEKPPGSSVIEIGSAAGWNLVTFQRAGYAVRGYEYTKTLVQVGCEYGLDIREGGAADAEGRYDVVVVNHVLEHVPDIEPFVDHLKRLMKPDGILYIGVPDIEVYGPGQFQSAHCYYFTRRTLSHYMGRMGLFADTLPGVDGVAFHGLFRQRPGEVVSLADEYGRMCRAIMPRQWWAAVMNSIHHLSTHIPG